MRQLAQKIMKSMVRIAICSIGGVLTIFGIMFGLCFLVQLPDDLFKYLPYFFLAVLTLSVGLYLCFLVIKPMRYFVKSHKMSKEERVIKNIKTYMKKGKSRIAAFTFLLILMVSISILIMSMWNKIARTMTPENIRLLNLAKLIVYQWHFSLVTGFIIAMLIIEISGLTKNKHRLTLSMWERIQQLENEVKDLKAHTQADDQQIDGMDGGDVVVN